MKTKRLIKLGAVLSAALVLLSGILSVSAASVPQAVIDTGRKASVSLYKYDFTSAHADGVLGDNTYISTGYADENVENTLMPYAIEGVVFSYAKLYSAMPKSPILRYMPKQKTANIKICCCINCRAATKPPRL